MNDYQGDALFNLNYAQLEDRDSEMALCAMAHVRSHANTEEFRPMELMVSNYSGHQLWRLTNFMSRHNLWEQFAKEDAAGLGHGKGSDK